MQSALSALLTAPPSVVHHCLDRLLSSSSEACNVTPSPRWIYTLREEKRFVPPSGSHCYTTFPESWPVKLSPSPGVKGFSQIPEAARRVISAAHNYRLSGIYFDCPAGVHVFSLHMNDLNTKSAMQPHGFCWKHPWRGYSVSGMSPITAKAAGDCYAKTRSWEIRRRASFR